MTAIKLKTDKYQLLQHLIDDLKDEGLIDKRKYYYHIRFNTPV